MSTGQLDSIADNLRLGYKLRIECKCGPVRVIEPGDLIVALGRRKNSSREMELLISRLKCFVCGGEGRSIGGPV